ncbi:helix-turn-helix domain-containing protein [Caulobacter segnis]|nr:helix-turn-helix domain-containing protein [Caulobacter segnis]
MVIVAPTAFSKDMTSFALDSALSSSSTTADLQPHAGIATRAGADFLLDQLVEGAASHDGDLLAALVLAALSSGNCAHLPADRFATLDNPPPDRDRRPVSVRQIAQSLGQPYETVRRRFVALEAAGLVVRRGRGGFIVPEAADRSKERLDAARRTHGKIQRLLKTLQALERR